MRRHLLRYPGSLILNLGAFFLPALYNTLSKLWVANIDSSQVVLTDVYAYIGIVAEVLNDTFPRSAWHVIGDNSSRSVRSRFNLGYTLMIATATQGFVLMTVFVAYPQSLASAFVPEEVRGISLTYVRLSSVQFLTSATEAALSSSTRALDNPDVPLIFSSAKFVINIMLDFLVISKFHVTKQNPTIVSQAVVRLICDFVSVVAGLLYFSLIVARKLKIEPDGGERLNIGVSAFMTLLKPSVYTFTESAIRNAIYLWLVNRIVQMGETYATAWGVFNTIRWGLVMVPVQALESSTLAFVGHAWGSFRASAVTNHPRASRKDILSKFNTGEE
jgi:Na+-driven multidrug efflux pump